MASLEKLQIRDLIPDDEICQCSTLTRLHLRYAISEFPFFCLECNGQIFPDALKLDEKLAGEIVNWRETYSSLYSLWLASGAYEGFAKEALLDPQGEVNIRGVRLAKQITTQRPTFYWYFRDLDDSSPKCCPLCSESLEAHESKRFQICNDCGLAI